MKVAGDAWNFFVPSFATGTALVYFGYPVVGELFLIIAGFVLFFFRDPTRVIPSDPRELVSPADGLVHKIDEDWFDPETGEKRIRLSIFLSVFNVHINRYPVSGTVEKVEIRDGKFLAAFNHMASEENAQSVLVIASPYGRIVFKQIVGLIARRIVCWAKAGDVAVKGERFGLIRFGSRMDVTMPAGTRLKVKVGDKVSGGSSVLATL
ncbi:MAG: phosphatidylserine decarboxylase family protein [Nitrospinae bacterium]|nr:phosphatidylserine decarboxylase family protein [Nitrospinota bacterium]